MDSSPVVDTQHTRSTDTFVAIVLGSENLRPVDDLLQAQVGRVRGTSVIADECWSYEYMSWAAVDTRVCTRASTEHASPASGCSGESSRRAHVQLLAFVCLNGWQRCDAANEGGAWDGSMHSSCPKRFCVAVVCDFKSLLKAQAPGQGHSSTPFGFLVVSTRTPA